MEAREDPKEAKSAGGYGRLSLPKPFIDPVEAIARITRTC